MTKLSPAARNVLEAFGKHPIHCDEITQGLIAALASGIKALAHNVYSEEVETCGGCSYALVIEVDDILEIAKEIENYALSA